jgi:hypothetical protein
VQACREKATSGLRPYVPESVTDADIIAMFAKGNDVQLLSQSVPDTTSDRVLIDVTLRVMSDAGEETVQRSWEFERIEGAWRMTELPECF